MSIIICKCGMWLKAPDPDLAGGLGRCPSCGRIIGAETDDRTPAPRRRSSRWKPSHAKRGEPLGILEAVLYPLLDGPGLALLVVFPPLLAFLSIPVFDIVLLFRSGPRGSFNPLALIILPIATPMFVTFVLFFGYALLYLGRILVASSMGREDHPRYPRWDWQTILDGVIRWGWAAIIGAGVGGLPAWVYIQIRGELNMPAWADQFVVLLLLAVGLGYAQMGLAAAILHDNIASAHPLTIARAIYRIGPEYLRPWLVTSLSVFLAEMLGRFVLNDIPNLHLAALGLWFFWIFSLYASMVSMRVLGHTYYRNGLALGWFRTQPRSGYWERPGQLYQNS